MILAQQIRILHKTNKKTFLVNCWPSGKYVHLLYIYSILGRGSFCFNYCLNSAWLIAARWSICGTAEVVWKPRFLWQWPSAHLHFLVSFFLIFFLTIPHMFSMGFRSGEFADQSSTPTPWSCNQLLVLLSVWAGAKSCLKMKSASLKSWSAEGSMKCSKMYW